MKPGEEVLIIRPGDPMDNAQRGWITDIQFDSGDLAYNVGRQLMAAPVDYKVTMQMENNPFGTWEKTEVSGSGYARKSSKIVNKEKNTMEKFTATLIERPAFKTINIYIEDKDGKFLTGAGARVERKMGEEMPLYGTMPLEVFNAISVADLKTGA